MPPRQSPSVVGLDLSLSRPAACFIPAGWEIGDWSTLKFESWKHELSEYLDVDAAKYDRLLAITNSVVSWIINHEPAHVFYENYSFGSVSSSVTKLAELGGILRCSLYAEGYTARPITASSARKLLLGKLPKKGAKVAVQRALYDVGAPFRNDDECDAFVISSAGLAELGEHFLTLA